MIDSTPAVVASPIVTPAAAVSTSRTFLPEAVFDTVAFTTSAALSVSWKSPTVVTKPPSVAMLLASPSVTVPAVPIRVPTVSVAPVLWLNAAVLRTSSVPAIPVRSVAAPTVTALAAAAPPLIEPSRSVVVLTV